jgi:hypothetical protein
MNLFTRYPLLRQAWPDFVTAAVFIFVAVALRQGMADSGVGWLIVPVVLELFVAFALTMMTPFTRVRDLRVLYAILAVMLVLYAGGAWWFAQQSDAFVNAHYTAAWLMVARFLGPDAPPLSRQHIEHVVETARYSLFWWVLAFVVYAMLGLFFAVDEGIVDGQRTATIPLWIWLTVWPAYFIVDGLMRADLIRSRRSAAGPARRSS